MTGINAYLQMEEGYEYIPYPESACPAYEQGCESSFCQMPECPAPCLLQLVDDATDDDFEWSKLGEFVHDLLDVGCCEDCLEYISQMNL